MFVPVLQLQSKINKVYQTRIRFKMENLFPILPLVSTHLTIGLISKVSTRTNQAVCALRSLSIMGGIQNLIICVKMAWSEHLDRGVNIR